MTELNTGSTLEESQRLVVMWHNKWAQERLEKQFIIEYLNPADTSFRQMMNDFAALPKSSKQKLIDLSKSLAELAKEGRGE